MNGTMNRSMQEMMNPIMHSAQGTISAKKSSFEMGESPLVAENCKTSGFSLAAFAGSVLLCVGIIVYALLTV